MRLRARGIPLALHADLGNDAAPTRYLPLMEEVLCLYPENVIVWVHMGLSRELTAMAAAQHMLAGNWKTARMVAHYSAGATAERGAVRKYL